MVGSLEVALLMAAAHGETGLSIWTGAPTQITAEHGCAWAACGTAENARSMKEATGRRVKRAIELTRGRMTKMMGEGLEGCETFWVQLWLGAFGYQKAPRINGCGRMSQD